MHLFPSTSWQSFAQRITAAIWKADEAQLRELLKAVPELTGSVSYPEPSIAATEPCGESRIGIWAQPEGDTKAPFRRLTRYRSEWRLWADMDEFPAVTPGRRIVLVGESVARGYFYDPVYTPAIVLRELLSSVPNGGDTDIVDLARSNLDPAGLVELVEQSTQLEPSLFVVFAGNNWTSSRTFSSASRKRLAQGLSVHGYRGYIDELERWRIRRTKFSLERIAAAAKTVRAPVILIVPEFNLADWLEDTPYLNPFLRKKSNEESLELIGKAHAALVEDNYRLAASMGQQLVELSDGASPFGFMMLGRCCLQSGEQDQAREMFEAARDIHRALPPKTTPGCARSIQQLFREAQANYGFHVVDLPRLMQEHLGALPDRRLFHDYCHLTSRGIRFVAEATAKVAVPLLGLPSQAGFSQTSGNGNVSPEVESDAHFMAALHTARWLRRGELVRYHVEQAVKYSPAATEKMLAYLGSLRGTMPPWMGETFELLARGRGSATFRYFCEVDPLVSPELDHDVLMQSVNDVLPELAAVGLRDNEGDNSTEPIDSLDLLSREHFAAGHWNSVSCPVQSKSFLEAYEPVSRFIVRLPRPYRFQLKICYRTPDANPDDPLFIRINGNSEKRLPADRKWTIKEFEASCPSSGMNEIQIEWPRPRVAFEDHLQSAVGHLRSGMLPNPSLVFGHCAQLRLVPLPNGLP